MNPDNLLSEIISDESWGEGLYLILPNNECVSITFPAIKKTFEEFCNDATLFSEEIRNSVDMRLCEHCPGKSLGEKFCMAIKPILPFLKCVDEYVSFDKVTAVYKSKESGSTTVKHCTLQDALRYISEISLMFYCKTNERYWKYFMGIVPLEETTTFLTRVYLNIFWLSGGNPAQVNESIETFVSEINRSAQCVLKRLRLVCRNDPFLNAIANTQVALDFMSMGIDDLLGQSMDGHMQRLSMR